MGVVAVVALVGVKDEGTVVVGTEEETGAVVDAEADVDVEIGFVLMVREDGTGPVVFATKKEGTVEGTVGLDTAVDGIDVGAVFGVNVGVVGFFGRW